MKKNQAFLVLLVLSIATNCFLAGLFAGHRAPPAFLEHHMGPSLLGPPGVLQHLEEVLSPQDARLFRAAMMQLPPPDFTEVKGAMEAVETVLRAKTFDPQAFQAALQHVHDQHVAMDTIFVQQFTKAVGKISPEGRSKLAEIIETATLPGGIGGGPMVRHDEPERFHGHGPEMEGP